VTLKRIYFKSDSGVITAQGIGDKQAQLLETLGYQQCTKIEYSAQLRKIKAEERRLDKLIRKMAEADY